MSGRVTPAVRSMEKADVAFQLLEYDYDPSADAIGLQAAHALGRSPSTVFKTLIVALDSGELVCAIIPSDPRLNLKRLRQRQAPRRLSFRIRRRRNAVPDMWSEESVPSGNESAFAASSTRARPCSTRSS
jgi:hypothetical protein